MFELSAKNILKLIEYLHTFGRSDVHTKLEVSVHGF